MGELLPPLPPELGAGIEGTIVAKEVDTIVSTATIVAMIVFLVIF